MLSADSSENPLGSIRIVRTPEANHLSAHRDQHFEVAAADVAPLLWLAVPLLRLTGHLQSGPRHEIEGQQGKGRNSCTGKGIVTPLNCLSASRFDQIADEG